MRQWRSRRPNCGCGEGGRWPRSVFMTGGLPFILRPPRPTSITSQVIDAGALPLAYPGIVELVADAAHGDEAVRAAGRPAQPTAHALDQRVDASHGHERAVAPHLRQERLAPEHDAGLIREHAQQLELLLGELQVVVLHLHAPPRGIDDQAAADDDRGRPAHTAQLADARAAEERADARDELAHAERAGQVVVDA